MKISIFIIILFMTNQAIAFDEWSKNEIGLQALSTGLQVVDWGMTLDIVDRGDENYWEINPILGEHPDRGKVNTYFALSIVSNILIAHILPSDWRKVWLGGRIMVSGYLIDRNYGIGLRINF